jgi:hypothetical protein
MREPSFLFHTDGWTEMTKPIVAFRDCAKVSKEKKKSILLNDFEIRALPNILMLSVVIKEDAKGESLR